MFSTGRTCRQPTEAWAYQVPLVPCRSNTLVQPFGVVGEVGQIDGAVLNERDRFPVALHRHHDVQPGLAHRGDVGLERRLGRAHHRAGMAEVAHQRFQLAQLRQQRRVLIAVELDDQQAVGLADQHPVDRRAIDRDAAAELDHRAIDQFHRLGVEVTICCAAAIAARNSGTGRCPAPCAA